MVYPVVGRREPVPRRALRPVNPLAAAHEKAYPGICAATLGKVLRGFDTSPRGVAGLDLAHLSRVFHLPRGLPMRHQSPGDEPESTRTSRNFPRSQPVEGDVYATSRTDKRADAIAYACAAVGTVVPAFPDNRARRVTTTRIWGALSTWEAAVAGMIGGLVG